MHNEDRIHRSDRTDLQRATRHMEMLKKCTRYLVHSPRLLQVFKRQKILTRLDVYRDSDHAGCLRTRKCTSGCVVMAGCNQLRSICRGQAVVALSSGEAEFYALVTSASEALGEQAIAREWDVRLDITLWFDATAGAAVSSRRGLGRVKHIHTAFLWIQSYVTNRVIILGKKHTRRYTHQTCDIGTDNQNDGSYGIQGCVWKIQYSLCGVNLGHS